MSTGVEFEEDSFNISPTHAQSSGGGPTFQSPSAMYSQGYSGGEERGMAGWLMRHGLAKSPQTAQIIMLGIVVINIIITFVALKYFL